MKAKQLQGPKLKEYRIPIYQIRLVRDSSVRHKTGIITTAGGVYGIMRKCLQDRDREYLVVLMLDAKRKIIEINTISVGTLTWIPAESREIFKAALLCNAAAIITAHNHPNATAIPSSNDKYFYEKVAELGDLLHIEVCDQIILGDETCWSRRDSKRRKMEELERELSKQEALLVAKNYLADHKEEVEVMRREDYEKLAKEFGPKSRALAAGQ